MKKIKTLFAVATLAASLSASAQTKPAAAQTKLVVTYFDEYTKQHVQEKYHVSTTAPYLKEGLYEEFSKDGKLVSSASFKADKLNGKETDYFDDLHQWYGGKPVRVLNWKMGVQYGAQKIYDCGQRKSGKKIDGQTQYEWYYSGEWKVETWSDEGLTMLEEFYSNGKKKSHIVPDGKCTGWFGDSVVLVWTNVSSVMKGQAESRWVKTGLLRERWTNTEDGRREGYDTSWYKSGKIESIALFSMGLYGTLKYQKRDSLTSWYGNGKMKSQEVYEGKCTSWYENGQKSEEWSMYAPPGENPERRGLVTQWRKDGTLKLMGDMGSEGWTALTNYDEKGNPIPR